MITLITGGPGTGKTAWLVSQLMILKEQQPHRRLLVHGIKSFKLSHIQIFCRNPQCELCGLDDRDKENELFVEDWHIWKNPYDLIVIDEAQRAWKSKSGIVPLSISLLDTHRHHGVDFWLLTQSPKLLHVDVRVMCTRHIHLKSAWNGRKQFEWSEVSDNVQSTSDAVERSYKLPKHVYNFYKSAEVHTKQDKRRPTSFYVLIGLLMLTAVIFAFGGKRIYERLHPDPIITADLVAPPAVQAGGANNSGSSGVNDESGFPDFTPRVVNVPESAPAYDKLLKVSAVPVLAGCVENLTKKTCSCFTEQATPYPASYDYCLLQVQNKRFNPYHSKINENISDFEQKRGLDSEENKLQNSEKVI